MAEPKTRPTDASVDDYIASLENPVRREDAATLRTMLEEITGEPAVMWGDAIIGFGTYPIAYADGTTKDWPLLAFSPRKANTTVYFMESFDQYEDQLAKLGKHKTSKACLYITNFKNIDLKVLREMLEASHELYT